MGLSCFYLLFSLIHISSICPSVTFSQLPYALPINFGPYKKHSTYLPLFLVFFSSLKKTVCFFPFPQTFRLFQSLFFFLFFFCFSSYSKHISHIMYILLCSPLMNPMHLSAVTGSQYPDALGRSWMAPCSSESATVTGGCCYSSYSAAASSSSSSPFASSIFSSSSTSASPSLLRRECNLLTVVKGFKVDL